MRGLETKFAFGLFTLSCISRLFLHPQKDKDVSLFQKEE